MSVSEQIKNLYKVSLYVWSCDMEQSRKGSLLWERWVPNNNNNNNDDNDDDNNNIGIILKKVTMSNCPHCS